MSDPKTEKVLTAAREVFLRYGYKRTTMGDIAQAAAMSRPALYLVFASKEEIYAAVTAGFFAEKLAQIRAGLDTHPTVPDKLGFVFEIWCIEPFELTLASPDARDLLESGYLVATDLVTSAFGAFEAIVAGILAPLVERQARVPLSATEIARLLIGAAQGFKQTAKDAGALRRMIAQLHLVTCAGLAG